jgi:PAS domain S-box-containing protein
MTGIDLLKEIKKHNKDIPFIFTTAFTDSKYLLEAINLGVTHYAVKPINMKQLIVQIQSICSEKYAIEQLHKTQKTNKTYLDIINKVAIVSQTDIHGNITYANDIFCEVSGYTKEELIGSNQRIVRHPDMSTKFFDTLWNSLRAGEVWHGKLKNKAKNGTSYYVDAHIFPMYDADESMAGWMAVRFLITDSELEKQKYYKNMLFQIKEQKLLKQQIQQIEEKSYISENLDILQGQLNHEKKQLKKAKQFLQEKDEQTLALRNKLEKVVKDANAKNFTIAEENRKMKGLINEQDKLLDTHQDEVQMYLKNISELVKEKEAKDKRIIELLDVVKHLEEKLKDD